MGNKSWLKLASLLFIAHQIAAAKWTITTDGSQMVIHNAALKSDSDLADVDFSNFTTVKLETPQVRTLTVGMQSPMVNVKKLIVNVGRIVTTVHVASNFEDVQIVSSGHVRNVIIDPSRTYNTVEFAVKNCLLRKLPENLSAMKKLRVLNFENNYFSTVTLAELNGLNSLQELLLVNNRIKDIIFTEAVLPKLEILDLNRNRLTELNMDDFTAPLLTKLSVSENELDNLNLSQFNNLTNLNSLHLNENEIRQVTTTNPVNLPKLKLLTIASNWIRDISFEGWNAPALEEINIAGNTMKKATGLPAAFPALKKVVLFPNTFDDEWIDETLFELKARKIKRNQ